jgi:uncharacterized protein
MQFSQEQDPTSYRIRAYASGSIDIVVPVTDDPEADRTMTLKQSFIMTPDTLISDWPPQSLDQLRQDHIQILLELQPEVVLLGTGERLVFPPMSITTSLMEAGVGVEVMDTQAACRTYNILMHEGRRVAVALIQ